MLLTAKVVSQSSRPGRPSRPSRPGRPGRLSRPRRPSHPDRPDEVQQPQRNSQLRNHSSTPHPQTHVRSLSSLPTSMGIDVDQIDLTNHPSDDESLPPLEEILGLRPRQAQRQPETERLTFTSPDGS